MTATGSYASATPCRSRGGGLVHLTALVPPPFADDMMQDKQIVSKISGFDMMTWGELRTYERNDLKEENNRDVTKLKNAIVNDGFTTPFFIWSNHRYVLDGTGRCLALEELESEGFVVPELPVIHIDADNKEAAKRIVLMISSQHGVITQESLDRFIEDIDAIGIDDFINLPGLDYGMPELPDDDDDDLLDDFESAEEDEDAIITCPHCGKDFEYNPR